MAAEHADIVAFSGLRHKRGYPPGTLTAVTAEQRHPTDWACVAAWEPDPGPLLASAARKTSPLPVRSRCEPV